MNGKLKSMTGKNKKMDASAYGGENWTPRTAGHDEEIGTIWSNCGINSEWKTLKSVLIHSPGPELSSFPDPDSVQMLELPNWEKAAHQHNSLSQAYRKLGVSTYYVDPIDVPPPNLIFCADLFFMTPEGAILARPASTIRAGEERWISRRLADLGIPILRTLQRDAVFEGADALWIDDKTVLIGRGLRTNHTAILQIMNVLNEMGIKVIPVDLPVGTMHLMGILRFLNGDLALAWPYRLSWKAMEILRNRGVQTLFIPDEIEATSNGALNFVTLGPAQVMMAAGNPITQSFLESHGISCHTVDVGELQKAAGSIGCMTGVIERDLTL